MIFLILMVAIQPVSAGTVIDQYTYDANGNIIEGNGFVFEYNDANQLEQIVNASDSLVIAEYYYDARGQRVKKVEGGVTTYYIGSHYETRTDGVTTENTKYYFANNERIARGNPDGRTFYYHGDHLGSTSVVTNDTGGLSEKVSYLPYGAVNEHTGSGSTYLFTDQEFDAESELYYYDARYYDPELARFTQADTVIQDVYNPQNLNEYAYVLNNPVKYIDPSGHGFDLLYNHVVDSVKRATIGATTVAISGLSGNVYFAAYNTVRTVTDIGADAILIPAALAINENDAEKVRGFHQTRDISHMIFNPMFLASAGVGIGYNTLVELGLINDPVFKEASFKDIIVASAILGEGFDITLEESFKTIFGCGDWMEAHEKGQAAKMKWIENFYNTDKNEQKGGKNA